jgi:hypothetical protein
MMKVSFCNVTPHFAYIPSSQAVRKKITENPLEVLREYDTVILVDDSESMKCRGSKRGSVRWDEVGYHLTPYSTSLSIQQAREALSALADAAQNYDTDGIDIYFLNHKEESLHIKVRSAFASCELLSVKKLPQSSSEVRAIFGNVKPWGATPTGNRLGHLLRPLLVELEDKEAKVQPTGIPQRPKVKGLTEMVEIKPVNIIVITDGEPSELSRFGHVSV